MHNQIETRVRYIAATPEDKGQRLDNFLIHRLKGVPKSHVYRMIRKGEIRINSKRIKPLYKIATGDQIRIPPVRSTERQQTLINENLNWLSCCICFEDKDLLVINKPTGLAVHSGSGVKYGLIEYLRTWSRNQHLELVHRIDRYTSGCVLLVKRRSLLKTLQAIWHTDQVQKVYLALVAGKWPETTELVDMPLTATQLHGEKYIKADQQGQSAQTAFMLQDFFPGQHFFSEQHIYPRQRIKPPAQDLSLIQARLITGRTHQIRVHCSNTGHPVIGDTKYGNQKANRAMAATGYTSMFLHAYKLTFTHPATEEIIKVTAPLHADEQKLLDSLYG